MTDPLALAKEAVAKVQNWLDDGGNSWGLPAQSIERVLKTVLSQAEEIERLRERKNGYINGLSLELKSAESQLAAAKAEIAGAYERCATIAETVGNFGDYQRHELTADYGQPRYDMMVAIADAIRALQSKEGQP